MDIQQQVENFKSLPYETKREKVLEMLKQLQSTHETFAMLYKTVSTLDSVSQKVLLYLYQSIMEIAQEISVGNKNEAQDKIKKMTEVIMMIRRQEEIEKAREGDPENLLKNI